MLSEAAVQTFLEASITGAGLILAIYALITPLSQRIFERRAKTLQHLIEEFDKEKGKMTAYTSDKEFKHLKELKQSINEFRVFPRLWAEGVLLTFTVFIMSVFLDVMWLVSAIYRTTEYEFVIIYLFGTAVFAFFAIGIRSIGEIMRTMRKEFEDLNKRQEEARKFETPEA